METAGPIAVLFHRHKAVAKVLRRQLAAWSYRVTDLAELEPPLIPSLGLVDASANQQMRELAERFPTVPLVAVASLRRPFDVFDALRHGAWAAVVLQDIHAIRIAVGLKQRPGAVDPLSQTLERIAARPGPEESPSPPRADEAAAHSAAIRALIKGIGDRLNNPLATLKTGVETLRDALTELAQSERTADLLDVGVSCDSALERMLDLSRAVRNFALPSTLALGNLDIIRVIRELAPESELTAPEEAYVFANERAVREVLGALLSNAVESYAPQVATQPVAITVTLAAAKVSVAIVDRGCGMSEEVMARAFEPFFTHGKGPSALGMGLAVARDRIIAMRGTITLSSEPGAGTVATIALPCGH